MKAASFTGHRSISGNLNALKADMYNKLERAILNGGITQFNAGGAIGFDTIAAETVIELRKNYPDITLNLVLPCSPEEQTLKWTADQKRRFYDIMNNANNVEFTSPHYYDGCMKARNLRLIELADFCFCYWDKSKSWSGTAQTVGFALNKPIQVWNFYSNRLERK